MIHHKTFLGFLTRTIIFCVALSIQTNAHAGGPAAGGASEWTQVANWWQLTEQYTVQAATLVNAINSLDVMIRNAAQNPLGLLPMSDMTESLLRSLNNLQGIGDTMSEIDARWSHAYLDPPDGRTSSKFKLANDKNFETAKGALKSIVKQQQEFKKISAQITQLKSHLKSSIGSNGYLGVLAEGVVTAAEIIQREIFNILMPDIFVLRAQGYSFKQLKQLLNQCGLDIQIGDLRTYYDEYIFSCIKACEAHITKSLLAIAEIEARHTQ